MSPMRLLLLVIFLVNYCSSRDDDLVFQIQPQAVCINNLDEIYITSDDHYIGQVLYRHDSVELACECQTQLNSIQYKIYWSMDNKIINSYNNSNSIKLDINRDTVQTPITYVTCHCIFMELNLTIIKKNYQYQLYIDLESEPSLQPMDYSVESSIIKLRIYHFIQRHFIIIFSFIVINIGVTCLLIILSFTTFH